MKNVEILLYQGSVVVESLQSAELNLITDKRLTCQNGLKRVVYDAANPKEKKSEIRANEADISFEDSLLIDGDKIIRTDKLILTGNVHYKEDRIEIKSAEAEYSPLKAEMKGKGFVEVVLNGTKKIQGQEGFSFLSNEGLLDMFGIVSGEIRCN